MTTPESLLSSRATEKLWSPPISPNGLNLTTPTLVREFLCASWRAASSLVVFSKRSSRDLSCFVNSLVPTACFFCFQKLNICFGGVCLKISEWNWLGPACVETSAGRSAGGRGGWGGIPPASPCLPAETLVKEGLPDRNPLVK